MNTVLLELDEEDYLDLLNFLNVALMSLEETVMEESNPEVIDLVSKRIKKLEDFISRIGG